MEPGPPPSQIQWHDPLLVAVTAIVEMRERGGPLVGSALYPERRLPPGLCTFDGFAWLAAE